MDQRLDGLLDVELFEAGLAHGEVVADRVAGSFVDLVVQELVHALEYLLTVVERCMLGSFDVHVVLASARLMPRSRAYSANRLRSCVLPRLSRDITVPIGVPMISAISLYEKPSTSAR
jgi:hypothetical protein